MRGRLPRERAGADRRTPACPGGGRQGVAVAGVILDALAGVVAAFVLVFTGLALQSAIDSGELDAAIEEAAAAQQPAVADGLVEPVGERLLRTRPWTLPLPPPLVDALRTDRHRQLEARIHAGSVWGNSEMVFTTITGRPVAPRDHSVHWTAFLEGAGVRPARLHDARHTAATFLLVQGVDQRVVMSMFGWTSSAMTSRYQHVVPELVEEANRRMSRLLWEGAERPRSDGA